LRTKLALAGLLVVAVSLSVATGAVTVSDELTSPEAAGELQVTPSDSPNSDAYVSTEDGEISVTVSRLNRGSTAHLDRLFDVSYNGEGTAEFWVEAGESMGFYATRSRSTIGEDSPVAVPGDSGTNVSVGMRVDAPENETVSNSVTLVAVLPEQNGTDGGGTGGGGVTVDPIDEETEEIETSGNRTVVSVDVGEVSVGFEAPRFRYDVDVSRSEVPVSRADISGAASVIDRTGAEAGETVTVRSEVANRGEEAGTETVDLRVDGATVATEELFLSPGENETVAFEVVFDEPGSHVVEVGDSEPVVVDVYRRRGQAVVGGVVAVLVSFAAVALAYRRRREDA